MKITKRVAIAFLIYIGIVVTFESMLGFFQPANQSTLVITTHDGEGGAKDRVLARLESDGQLYVAANHWPRAWYKQVLENPNVEVTMDDATGAYRAVSVIADGEEHDRVNSDNSLGIMFRTLTGFPPRYFLRLEPVPTE